MGSEFEAIVVGAGPAGSMAAYELARAGVRVLLLERESLPRYKACGGGLTAKTVREVPFCLRSYRPNPIARSNHVFKVHIGGSQ